MHEQRQAFVAVRGRRTSAVCRQPSAATTKRPSAERFTAQATSGTGFLQSVFPLGVEQAQIPFRSEHKAGTVLGDGEVARRLVLL